MRKTVTRAYITREDRRKDRMIVLRCNDSIKEIPKPIMGEGADLYAYKVLMTVWPTKRVNGVVDTQKEPF